MLERVAVRRSDASTFDRKAEIVGDAEENVVVVALHNGRGTAAYQVLTIRDGRIVHIQDRVRRSTALSAIGRTSDEPEPPSLGISMTPSLTTRDIDATVRFYRDRLGFTVTGTHPDEERPTWVELCRDGVRLHFSAEEDAAPSLSGVLYFSPSDVLALFDELTAAGIQAEWGPEVMPYGLREFAVRDPSGYLLGFWEPANRHDRG